MGHLMGRRPACKILVGEQTFEMSKIGNNKRLMRLVEAEDLTSLKAFFEVVKYSLDLDGFSISKGLPGPKMVSDLSKL